MRLSASRSFKLPIVQLEGLSGRAQRDRVRQLTLRHRGVARAMTLAFANAELALVLERTHAACDARAACPWVRERWLSDLAAAHAGLVSSIAYAAAVAFLEPFYVAAGFGLYLNRRVELEAWDIEQEFRSAFAR